MISNQYDGVTIPENKANHIQVLYACKENLITVVHIHLSGFSAF